MEGEEENLRTPEWRQPTDTFWRSDDRRRSHRRSSSLILNSNLALVFLLVFVFYVVFVIVPSFLSFVPQIFRPRSAKKTWDSLNFVLVLFAILFGFLIWRFSENRSVSNVSDRTQNSNSSKKGESPIPKPQQGSTTSGETPSFKAAGKDGTKSPVSCPSPDINSKADSYIARFRERLATEMINSEQKQ